MFEGSDCDARTYQYLKSLVDFLDKLSCTVKPFSKIENLEAKLKQIGLQQKPIQEKLSQVTQSGNGGSGSSPNIT